jgi:hypothetical protein
MSVCDREVSVMRPWPTGGCWVMGRDTQESNNCFQPEYASTELQEPFWHINTIEYTDCLERPKQVRSDQIYKRKRANEIQAKYK